MTKEKLFSLTKKDFKIETMRGSGAGGQHRNKTDSAVRITHVESGASSYCCDNRKQSINKKAAFRQLTNSPKFKQWIRLEIARKTGVLDDIEKDVDKLMREENLRVEVRNGSKWEQLTHTHRI